MLVISDGYFLLTSRPAISPPATFPLIVVELLDLSTMIFNVHPARKPPKKLNISVKYSIDFLIYQLQID